MLISDLTPSSNLIRAALGWVDVVEEGATGDGTTNDAIAVTAAIAIAAAYVDGGTVHFPARSTGGTYLIGTNMTVPSNVTLMFDGGALMEIATGVTVTINGYVRAGDHPWVNLLGTAVLDYNPNTIQVVAELTDEAIQAASDNLPTFGGRVELIGANQPFVVTAPVVWAGAKALDLGGQGMFATILDWQGGINSQVLRMDSTVALLPYGDRIHDLAIRNSVLASGMVGIQNNTSGVSTNRNIGTIERVEILNFATAIHLYNGIDQFVIRQCALTTGTSGIVSTNPTAGSLATLTIEDCIIADFSSWALDLVIAGGCRLLKCFIHGSGGAKNGIRVDKFDALTIESHMIELTDSSGTAIYIGRTATGGANFSGGWVSANHINFNSAVAGSKGLVLDHCRNVVIGPNSIGGVETGIELTANCVNPTILPQNWADTVTKKLVDNHTGTLVCLDPVLGMTGLILDPEYQFQYQEDFRSAAAATFAAAATVRDFVEAWVMGPTGTYANVASALNGVIRVTGDATNPGAISWGFTSLPLKAAQSPVFKCRWAQKGTGAGNRIIGVSNSVLSADATQGWYFRHSVGGTITAVCRSGGADVATLSTGVAAADGVYHEGRLVFNGATSIDVYLDRVFIGNFATGGLIVASLMGLSAGATCTAIADGLDIDYMSISQNRL